MTTDRTTVRATTPWRRTSAVDLAASVLLSTPSMPNCSCRDHLDLFDAAVDGDRKEREEAQQVCVVVCSRCPVLGRCQQWAVTMTPQERSRLGVVAGLLPKPVVKPKPAPAIPGPLRAADGSMTGGRLVMPIDGIGKLSGHIFGCSALPRSAAREASTRRAS